MKFCAQRMNFFKRCCYAPTKYIFQFQLNSGDYMLAAWKMSWNTSMMRARMKCQIFNPPLIWEKKILPHLNIPLTIFWKIGRHSGFKVQPIYFLTLIILDGNYEKIVGNMTTKIFFPFHPKLDMLLLWVPILQYTQLWMQSFHIYCCYYLKKFSMQDCDPIL